MKTFVAVILSALISIAGGIVIGSWLQRPTIDDLIAQTNELAEQDSIRLLDLENQRTVIQRLTFDRRDDQLLIAALRNTNEELADSIEAQGAVILSLINTTTELRDRLEGTDDVVEDDQQITVHIDQENQYESGRIAIEGSTTINKETPTEAETALDVFIQTSPTIVWTRNDDNTSEISLDFGDMPIEVTSLEGQRNVEDPIHERVRPPFPEIAWKTGLGALGIVLLVLVLR